MRAGSQRDAAAVQRRLDHQCRRVEHGAGQRRRLGPGGFEPGRPFLVAIGAQQGLPGEIGGRVEPGRSRCVAKHRQRRLEQQYRFGPVPGAVAEADREIEPLLGDVDPIVVGGQPQVDLGMRGFKGSELRQQPPQRKGADGADRQQCPAPPFVEAGERRGDPIESIAQHRQQRLALVGQGQPARQPMEERRGKPFLQRLDLMAERGRRHAQFDRGLGEAQMPRRRLEGAQAVKREIGADHDARLSPGEPRESQGKIWPASSDPHLYGPNSSA